MMFFLNEEAQILNYSAMLEAMLPEDTKARCEYGGVYSSQLVSLLLIL